ncbi:uncharacterized protein L969DRAFT_16813 [Mixia osmundae IAM 14324]|uniref:Domain of unknown function at the cortex 1 domain-containing protein n=1 Tax=Mixia osmundae (strain CBS 9802 / IAM 14324 / JCM 22182 / KY 12970) TaxID=764103 RepID=G7E8N8_MIXOS|nr:uncharacterized protein L969DRAFT_16813 [Mixia osmundae IAM 14324]KEI40142.1 hypothetical protein L969DRAFT_16813 [Mixia osmundae IAM 14324]GAA99506.1 hypothetical protein E5Q_06207 [Mixia osmundae IAM 14324]
MPPHLKITAGPSQHQLATLAVNHDVSKPTRIESDEFDGYITVRIASFEGDSGNVERLSSPESGYFEKHKGLTWSIHIQGRFLKPVKSHELVFGNTFDRPLRDSLPYGTSVALRFVNLIDPSLKHDLYGDKPWAFSPLLATMNFVNTRRLESDESTPEWQPDQPKEDATSLLPSEDAEKEHLLGQVNARRKYFGNAQHSIELTSTDLVSCDFCNGFIDFNTLSVHLPGFSISLAKYWDGQPVRYVCQTEDGKRTFFVVVFDIIDESILAEKGLAAADRQPSKTSAETEATASESKPEPSPHATVGEQATTSKADLPPSDGLDLGID